MNDHYYLLNLVITEEYGNMVGEESTKTWLDKAKNGFFTKYMSGKGLDIGYKGYLNRTVLPILPTARGLTLDDYDGVNLPVESNSQDYIYSSHVLEHIDNRKEVITDWHRALKPGGYIVCVVPHQWLYERKESKPSRWNGDHKVFYTASNLCKEFEDALPVNSFRIRYLEENDKDHTYGVPVEIHANGCYEMIIVVQKL